MSPVPSALLVDDDQDLLELMGDYLHRNGIGVTTATNAEALDRALSNQRIDVIILDLMLPGEDGLSICKRLAGRERIIMLSGADSEADRVVALEMGADDYLVKPCSPRELLARIRALLRRAGIKASASAQGAAIGVVDLGNGWRFDTVGRSVRAPDGSVIVLTSSEFDLMRAFLRHPQRVVSRETLAELIGGDLRSRAIDVQVSRLRHKLEAHSMGVVLIRTVRKEGYIFTGLVAGA